MTRPETLAPKPRALAVLEGQALTPPPVFTELKKPLSECKVAFITAGGIHKKSQTPFNTSGDFSYRVIEIDTPSSELMVTHGGFDNSDINKDVNAMFPIDRLLD